MQLNHRVFSDLARLGGGLFHLMVTVRQNLKTKAKASLSDLVYRSVDLSQEEFQAMREMLALERAEQDKIKQRLEALERRHSRKKM